MRAAAIVALAATLALSAFSEVFLLVPLVAAAAALALNHGLRRRRASTTVRPAELR